VPIGLFDSGVGGLTIHRALTHRLPAVDFIYLADQANMPYGNRSGQEIVHLTRAGCERLFQRGCDLIVLACNTASAIALQQLQQSWLPGVRQTLGRPVNVLGIIVPTIEVVTGRPWAPSVPWTDNTSSTNQVIGIFATRATARSNVYQIEITKRRKDLSVVTESCPGLAALIEQETDSQELARVITSHVAAMRARVGRLPDKVILASTHYEIAAWLFRTSLPPTTAIIQQPIATAEALDSYLTRHPEYHTGTSGLRQFLTTGRPGPQHSILEAYLGEPICFDPA